MVMNRMALSRGSISGVAGVRPHAAYLVGLALLLGATGWAPCPMPPPGLEPQAGRWGLRVKCRWLTLHVPGSDLGQRRDLRFPGRRGQPGVGASGKPRREGFRGSQASGAHAELGEGAKSHLLSPPCPISLETDPLLGAGGFVQLGKDSPPAPSPVCAGQSWAERAPTQRVCGFPLWEASACSTGGRQDLSDFHKYAPGTWGRRQRKVLRDTAPRGKGCPRAPGGAAGGRKRGAGLEGWEGPLLSHLTAGLLSDLLKPRLGGRTVTEPVDAGLYEQRRGAVCDVAPSPGRAGKMQFPSPAGEAQGSSLDLSNREVTV